MSLIETDSGVIVIDPLMSNETAAAALALYREHRGDRPVKALIITHSHADHYGGTAAVTDDDTPIYAPSGFLEHAVSENVYAGAAMSAERRTSTRWTCRPVRPVRSAAGLDKATSNGTISLKAPTVDVTHTGQEATIDGVRVVFQVTPGTEAPAEMNFYFPDSSGAVHGGERDAHAAPDLDAARCRGPGRACVVALSRGGRTPLRC